MKNYLKNCKNLFPIYSKYERQFIQRLKSQIEEYQLEIPNATCEDLIKQFGSPTEVIVSYYDNVDINYLLKKTNLVKHIRIYLAIFISLLILFFSYKSYVIYQSFEALKDSVIIYEETNIEDY